MSKASVYEELDQLVTAFIAEPDRDVASYVSTQGLRPELRELLEMTAQLEHVARPAFKAQLMQDLLDEAFVSDSIADVASYIPTHKSNGNGANGHAPRVSHHGDRVLPSLFGLEAANPMQRRNFAASMLLHTVAVGALVASSTWMVREQEVRPRVTTVLTEIDAYVAAPALPKPKRGGGGGGEQSRLIASQGQPPKFAEEQFTPPVVVPQNPQPELPAVPTVLGREQNLPQLSRLGDPLSNVVPASNGTGSRGGIGLDAGTGVGGGNGAGTGFGTKAGTGGGEWGFGGALRSPRPIYSPEPEYSDEARKVKHQGTVILWGVVGTDGLPRQLRVARSLGMGLDEKALEAVKNWRFDPAMKDGQPVAVQIKIEVNFRLH